MSYLFYHQKILSLIDQFHQMIIKKLENRIENIKNALI
ncbi:hypothetical protein F952_01470 [Acinetobacter baylyi DSM 14961 = CIP 107474]|nr:hypothetical protein F952_01470 [Acinetobacter baylyi DSM 14961 = CIP 107474]